MAKIVKPNGAVETVTPRHPENGFELEEIQALVEGYIELIQLETPVKFTDDPVEYSMMVVNENGKRNNLDPNEAATNIWEQSIGYDPGDVLVGNVVFVTRKELQ